MLTVFDVANYFLTLRDDSAGDLISNLKLQKLVYYAQGFCLALYNRPLFNETLEAWMHGPVSPALYHQYKSYGAGAVELKEVVDFSIYSEEEKELLNEVYQAYGQFSAWRLREMTHEESPWRDCCGQEQREISHESLRDFFKTRIN